MTPYYEPEGGGLERYAHAILRRLSHQGHEIQAVSFTRNGSHGIAHQDGVPVQRIKPRVVIGNSPIDLNFPATLGRKIKEFRPEIVMAHTPVPFPAEIAGRTARKHKVPFVLTYHAGRLRGSSLPLDCIAALDRHSFERQMVSQSDAIIAVSPFVRDQALHRVKNRVYIVPPGVDVERYRSDAKPPADPRILFVGPLSKSYRWKGVDVLWQAFTRIQKRFPTARLTLVGEGDRKAGFEARAKKEGLNVHAPGRLDETSLISEYGSSTLVVLPSTSDAESFGMVLAEANACGRPVVASRIGGIPHFVHHRENGLLVAPGDPVDLADRITQILLDPEQGQRMGETGRERVRIHHNWDELTARTGKVLAGAIGAPR